MKIKRLRDNQVQNSVSVCENERNVMTQGRGSTQFQVSYEIKTLVCTYIIRFILQICFIYTILVLQTLDKKTFVNQGLLGQVGFSSDSSD